MQELIDLRCDYKTYPAAIKQCSQQSLHKMLSSVLGINITITQEFYSCWQL